MYIHISTSLHCIGPFFLTYRPPLPPTFSSRSFAQIQVSFADTSGSLADIQVSFADT